MWKLVLHTAHAALFTNYSGADGSTSSNMSKAMSGTIIDTFSATALEQTLWFTFK